MDPFTCLLRFAALRRTLLAAVVLWQQMPFGGCLCSDGHLELFCGAGLFGGHRAGVSSDADAERSFPHRAGNRTACPPRMKACCQAAAQRTPPSKTGKRADICVGAPPCGGCKAIGRTSDAVLANAVAPPAVSQILDWSPEIRGDLVALGDASASHQPWPDVGLGRPPLLTSLCRLVI